MGKKKANTASNTKKSVKKSTPVLKTVSVPDIAEVTETPKVVESTTPNANKVIMPNTTLDDKVVEANTDSEPVKIKTCKDCGKGFSLTQKEIEFFIKRGLVEPLRCKPCIAVKKKQRLIKIIEETAADEYYRNDETVNSYFQSLYSGLKKLDNYKIRSIWKGITEFATVNDTNNYYNKRGNIFNLDWYVAVYREMKIRKLF